MHDDGQSFAHAVDDIAAPVHRQERLVVGVRQTYDGDGKIIFSIGPRQSIFTSDSAGGNVFPRLKSTLLFSYLGLPTIAMIGFKFWIGDDHKVVRSMGIGHIGIGMAVVHPMGVVA